MAFLVDPASGAMADTRISGDVKEGGSSCGAVVWPLHFAKRSTIWSSQYFGPWSSSRANSTRTDLQKTASISQEFQRGSTESTRLRGDVEYGPDLDIAREFQATPTNLSLAITEETVRSVDKPLTAYIISVKRLTTSRNKPTKRHTESPIPTIYLAGRGPAPEQHSKGKEPFSTSAQALEGKVSAPLRRDRRGLEDGNGREEISTFRDAGKCDPTASSWALKAGLTKPGSSGTWLGAAPPSRHKAHPLQAGEAARLCESQDAKPFADR
ncbi:hypothetical protein BDV98DRAFT_584253 [Pterulicium gracile]|uniref:Uncharacterized protein n=1 Tax=Pterulicium gracile TaxID=1884261 RepID=A0A5C3QAZ8_9AGAR|nr:hypothetical protein BDV98DRAFT_584253 [Pterula gracilis]